MFVCVSLFFFFFRLKTKQNKSTHLFILEKEATRMTTSVLKHDPNTCKAKNKNKTLFIMTKHMLGCSVVVFCLLVVVFCIFCFVIINSVL